MDGRLMVVEGQLEAMEIAVKGIKAETVALRQDSVAMRQDLQEIMRMLGDEPATRTANNHTVVRPLLMRTEGDKRKTWEEERTVVKKGNPIGGKGWSFGGKKPRIVLGKEGRCFRCRWPFSPGHHCPEKNLRMVILVEDEEEERGETETELDHMQMESSAFSARGLTQPRIMKLHAQIRGRNRC